MERQWIVYSKRFGIEDYLQLVCGPIQTVEDKPRRLEIFPNTFKIQHVLITLDNSLEKHQLIMDISKAQLW